MPSSAARLRAMIAELRAAGLDTDKIARRAKIPRDAVLPLQLGRRKRARRRFRPICILFETVTGRPPPER